MNPSTPRAPRTLAQTMRRPRYIGLLALALAVSAAFAWLGQWQLERALSSIKPDFTDTETLVEIGTVVKPAEPMRDTNIGRRVAADGGFVEGDYLVIANRLHDGVLGYWVSGHFETDAGISLPVALGWTESGSAAQRLADDLNSGALVPASQTVVEGRLLPSQAPADSDEGDPFELRSVSAAQLINLWPGYTGGPVYGAYLLSESAPVGLDIIDAPPPEAAVELNWLNIFYAIEWAVFAGFAIFLWYRLARDASEREFEEAEEADAAERELEKLTTSERID